jgi:hypothetical protein
LASCHFEVTNRNETTTVYTRSNAALSLCGRLSEFSTQLAMLKGLFSVASRAPASGDDLKVACTQFLNAHEALPAMAGELERWAAAAPLDQRIAISAGSLKLAGLRHLHDTACGPSAAEERQIAARAFVRETDALLGNEYVAIVRAGCIGQSVQEGTQAPSRADRSQSDVSVRKDPAYKIEPRGDEPSPTAPKSERAE